MAGEKVISGNMRLKLGDKTVFHALDCSLSLNREFKERATKDTAGTERAKSTKSFSASYNGLATHAGDGVGTHDFYDLFDLYNDDTDTPIALEFEQATADGAARILTGNCFIESLELTGANNEDATLSMSLVGDGVISNDAVA